VAWRDRWSLAALSLVASLSVLPAFAGYIFEPRGLSFTGAATYADDLAQHELWAREMAAAGGYQNLLTPEPTSRGWFFSPLEFVLGVVQKLTSIPYPLVSALLVVACAPGVAVALVALARRSGIDRPHIAALVALLAGSFAPFVVAITKLGLLGNRKQGVISAGGSATPPFAGAGLELLLAAGVVLALAGASDDPARRFRRAGALCLVVGMIYPFYVPTLWLTAALCAALWARREGWRASATGLASFIAIAAAPVVYYAVLPHLDPEFAHFSKLNRQPLLGVVILGSSLGLGLGALLGAPRLLRGTRSNQVLGCFAVALFLALNLPGHPWRQNLLKLSPLMTMAAIAAWWPLLREPRRRRWRALAAAVVAAAFVSTPYYLDRDVDGLRDHRAPQYLTQGETDAIAWLARQPRPVVVLAPVDVSPWVAARARQRVVVAHYLWTREWKARRRDVDAVFERGSDPAGLIRRFRITWVLLDRMSADPAWARDVAPAARFGSAVVLRASDVLARRARRRRTASVPPVRGAHY
jgi:hypothetical protein